MDNLMWGGEAILRNDKIVGYLTSAAYGYTIGRPVLIRNPAGVVMENFSQSLL